jgi:DNA-binding MarR family transcriptional regulator
MPSCPESIVLKDISGSLQEISSVIDRGRAADKQWDGLCLNATLLTNGPKRCPASMVLVQRLLYLNERYMAHMLSRLRKQKLTLGSYGLLACLRRSGEPYAMSPQDLFKALSLSSGGVSVLIEQMEKGRLIKRVPDPNDRRGVLVKLTNRGQVIAD